MKKVLTVALLLAATLSIPLTGSSLNKMSIQDEQTVSVEKFGAKGDGHSDDAPAITKAIAYCIANNKTCLIPKTNSFYNINTTIRVANLDPGHSLKIQSDGAIIKPLAPPINSTAWNLTAFKEHIFLSVGRQLPTYRDTSMFKLSAGTAIAISGLIFDGSNLPGKFAPTDLSTNIFIGLQVLADNVTITDCLFKNIYGYGAVVYNVKTSLIKNCKFENVGGRGATMFAQKVDHDSFGDGIHFALVKTNGNIDIEGCSFLGMKMNGKRSRDGITFEFSTQPYKINISDVEITGYAKCLHIEETAPSTVTLNHVSMRDFNEGIANVANDRSTVSLNNVRMDVGVSDGNESGDALAFLNYRSRAKITVDNSYLNFHGRNQAYQSASGLARVENSTINGNNTNFFFADGSTVFDNCTFIGFGGSGKSFAGGPASSYKLINCNLERSSTIHANGQKLQLSVK